MSLKMEASWYAELKEEVEKPYFQELRNFLSLEKETGAVVYPPEPLIFRAFLCTPFPKVKVVIMGQDPYHGKGQAHGLSFSVPQDMPLPPSLKNIFQELRQDLGIPESKSGLLEGWARQGVLLLNATLTVRAGEPKSHYGKGWETFTDAVIAHLLERKDPIVFLLWGKSAQEKVSHILQHSNTHHLVLTAAHPSPYSVSAFYGCRHFSKANAFLTKMGKTPIDWSLSQ